LETHDLCLFDLRLLLQVRNYGVNKGWVHIHFLIRWLPNYAPAENWCSATEID
jgi:hypothetical protein